MTEQDIRIALDLDGVLAQFHEAVLEHSSIAPEQFDVWGFDDEDSEEFEETGILVWEQHADEIEPTESDLAEHVAALREFGTVDIVTNTLATDEVVEFWLDKHGIEYNDIVRARANGVWKYELDYDVYIDDNPLMVGEPDFMYLYSRVYNDSYEKFGDTGVALYDVEKDKPVVASNIPVVARVRTLQHVVDDLHWRLETNNV